MRGISSKVIKTLTASSCINCNDNSGAKILKIIGVVGYKGVRGRYPKAGVGDVVICSVVAGAPKIKGTVVKAVIVRQKKEIRRANGMRICFEDNAAALVNDENLPIGTEIKGVVAREISENFSKVVAIAPAVV